MTLAPANLTLVASSFTAEDFARAVRHGVSPAGRPYIHMPADDRMWHMSDRDLGHIVAYLRTLPRVERSVPPTELKLAGMLFDAVGMVPVPMVPSAAIDHDAPRPADPEVAPTRAFGQYLARVTGCAFCHGEHLSGGPVPLMPPEAGVPANLTPHESGLAGWTRERFATFVREGRREDGTRVDEEKMPFDAYARFTDVEVDALWAYLQSVEPRPFGER